MKLGFRIFLFYLAIFAACLYFATDWIWTTLRSRYLESVEEPLADSANLLAALAEREMARPDFSYDDLKEPLARAHARVLSARIYDLEKREVDLQVYITDARGRVVLDTRSPGSVGQDYSRYHDVKFTLAGGYGTRASRSDPDDPFSTVLYIGAPIYRDGKVGGVLTVAEPTVSIDAFLQLARPAFVRAGLLTPTLCISYGGRLEELDALPGYASLKMVCEEHGVTLYEAPMSVTGMVNVGTGAVTLGFASEEHEFSM